MENEPKKVCYPCLNQSWLENTAAVSHINQLIIVIFHLGSVILITQKAKLQYHGGLLCGRQWRSRPLIGLRPTAFQQSFNVASKLPKTHIVGEHTGLLPIINFLVIIGFDEIAQQD